MADLKMLAHYLERSAQRLERLLAINAPQIVIRREVQIAGNRLRDIKAALPADAASAIDGVDSSRGGEQQ